MQHTVVKGPDTSFTYLPAQTVCGNSMTCLVNSYGGQFVTFNFSSIPGRAGDYEYMPIPHGVASLYGNFVSDDYDWGRVGYTAGVRHTSYTSGTVPNAVIYPAYYLVNMSAFYQHKNVEIDLNVNNVFQQALLHSRRGHLCEHGRVAGRRPGVLRDHQGQVLSLANSDGRRVRCLKRSW